MTKSEQLVIEVLTELLCNDVISENNYIEQRENVNTIEDIAIELYEEYKTLIN